MYTRNMDSPHYTAAVSESCQRQISKRTLDFLLRHSEQAIPIRRRLTGRPADGWLGELFSRRRPVLSGLRVDIMGS